MKYYIAADVHGFYTEFHDALDKAGYFTDPVPHKLIILGDLFDRGQEAVKMQHFILELIEKDTVILVRGNHEDLYEEMITIDEGLPVRHHRSNGTYDTALQLTGYDPGLAIVRNCDFAEAAQNTPFFRQIIPAMADWYETEHYVFVHGWIFVFCLILRLRHKQAKFLHEAGDAFLAGVDALIAQLLLHGLSA